MQVINGRRGFTLVEVIVILAVLSILVALAVPAALRIFQVTAEEGTRDEMLNLKEAMIGNPDKLRGNVRSDFAFLGDIGRLPANLDEILAKGALPAFAFDGAKQAGAGWNGPYITGSFAGEESDDFKNDQLGNAYLYSDVDFTNGNGELADGKITSAGADGTFGTADDIVIEILKNETEGTVRGRVVTSSGAGVSGTAVDLNFPSNGTLNTVTATTDAGGNFAFTSVPFGPRSVTVSPDVVLTNLTAVYSAPGEYKQVFVDGSKVADGKFNSGDTVPFSPSVTIAATSGGKPSRVFVDAFEVLLPNIIQESGLVLVPGSVNLGKKGKDLEFKVIIVSGSTEAKMEMKKFKNDITGIPFTITFSNGSVVNFTP
jgi:prepilin-type N-terminal cleavage/methylation domain-containing protein